VTLSMHQALRCARIAAFATIAVSDYSGAQPMTFEQTIRNHSNEPLAKSIGPAAKSLAIQTVLVPIEGVVGSGADRLKLKTAVDTQGSLWAYAYTSKSELTKAFPKGSQYAEMTFPSFFKIIEPNPQFGGIYLNSASDTRYPLPRQVFNSIKAQMPHAD
jgi:hypothetical protein